MFSYFIYDASPRDNSQIFKKKKCKTSWILQKTKAGLSSIFIIQRVPMPKNGLEFLQKSIGTTILFSLFTMYSDLEFSQGLPDMVTSHRWNSG